MGGLSKILGVMLANGMGGHTGRGPAFAAAMPLLLGKKGKKLKKKHYGYGAPHTAGTGMGLTQKAGLAALAYLAYKAYQDSRTTAPTSAPSEPGDRAGNPLGGILDRLGLGGILGGAGGGPGGGSGGGGASGGLGDRLAGILRGGTPEPDLGDARALLLIRAMITAANADGEISADEQGRILASLDAAGAGPDERRIVEQELRSPRPMDDIVREVGDPDTAEQVYLASELAVRGGTDTDRQYLSYLASRLRLPDDRRRDLDAVVQSFEGPG
ncbi:tellurite resistance TerB family protein [Azospirillum halopraeferens]|uniref:tellurite resistance TerB family protein n=1 Tax=Azospirillum halopraeferens TaxID=34010 RepID=UPI0004097071|nr:tellurite resistance TerB family protein [Azospirillum halopraeferens]